MFIVLKIICPFTIKIIWGYMSELGFSVAFNIFSRHMKRNIR